MRIIHKFKTEFVHFSHKVSHKLVIRFGYKLTL